MKQFLQEIIRGSEGFVELRYHKRLSNSFLAQKGRVDVANQSTLAGIGGARVDQWRVGLCSDR